jgi:type VI protein secretion system component VasF
MSSQTNSDWKRRLEDLEKEINQKFSPSSVEPTNLFQRSENAFNRIKEWVNSLPPPGRLAVTIVAVIVALSLLSIVLRVVTSLLSIAVLAIVLYLLYKFLMTPRSPN